MAEFGNLTVEENLCLCTSTQLFFPSVLGIFKAIFEKSLRYCDFYEKKVLPLTYELS